jgi:imidazolonepropionase-like amidohydrolase
MRRNTLLLLTALIAPLPLAAQDIPWALTNARIETVGRGTIEKGTIVIRDGLIAAVGANVAVPPDARVVDLTGRTVYPGIIDLTSTIGLPSQSSGAGAPRGPGGPGGQSSDDDPAGLTPQRSVAEELRGAGADARAAREAGITAALIAPTRGAFRGMAALVPMRDSLDERVLRAPVALAMGFQGVSGRYPQTLLGVIAYERQAMYDAQRYGLVMDRWRANPRGLERPVFDPAAEALVPVVRKERPVFFWADDENEIRRAVRLAKEFDLNLAVVGATEGFRATDALAGRTAIVSVNFPRPPSVTGWHFQYAARRAPDDSAKVDSAARIVIEGNAAALHGAGVRFALASGGLRAGEFLTNVRKAVERGLPREVALAAITQRPAELAGAGDMLGTIETGKIANLVVTENDLLSDSARIRMVFVDGIRTDVTAPPAGARGRRAAGAGAAGAGAAAIAQVGGTWEMTVNTPQGASTSTVTITQDGSTFRGTSVSEFGRIEFSDGRIEGRRMTWSATLTTSGQTIPLTFDGTLEGQGADRLVGTVGLGPMGNAEFTARKTTP